MTIEPLWDCVLIKRHDKIGQLYIPDGHGSLSMQRGEIAAVGPGVSKLHAGDDVYFCVQGARAAFANAIEHEGQTFIVAPAEAVLAIIRKEPATP